MTPTLNKNKLPTILYNLLCLILSLQQPFMNISAIDILENETYSKSSKVDMKMFTGSVKDLTKQFIYE